MVTQNRRLLFGNVVDGEIRLNELGYLVADEWQRLEPRFDHVVLGEFIVMPNHLHGILFIVDSNTIKAGHHQSNPVGAGLENSSQSNGSPFAPPLPSIQSATLGSIVRAYKSTTTRLINGLKHAPGASVWQRNYYEHIVRNENDLEAIRRYILNNPTQWESDRENSHGSKTAR